MLLYEIWRKLIADCLNDEREVSYERKEEAFSIMIKI